MDSNLKEVFDRVVAVSINKKNMKILNALNDVKKALNSREYTTTDRSYLKAVLFPEKSKGAKIPSIYPTSTNSFRQSTKFEIVVNDTGFFGIAMDVENTSNLIPVFYEFNLGKLDEWGSPRHLRFDGTQMSLQRYPADSTARVSDRKDASVVFDTARVVGASLSASIQKKPDDVYGTFEGALDPTARIDSAEYAPGTSPEIVTNLLMSAYDSLSNLGIVTQTGYEGFRVVYTYSSPLRDMMWNVASFFIDYIEYDQNNTIIANISYRAFIILSIGFMDRYDNRVLAGNLSMMSVLAGLSQRVNLLHSIKQRHHPADSKQMLLARKSAMAGSTNLFQIAWAELKILDMLETIFMIAGANVPQQGGFYDGNEFLNFCENLLTVTVQGITHRQRDFVKQRIGELVNVRTFPSEAEIFNSDRVRGLSFYSEAKASVGLRVLYVPTKANELVPIHDPKSGPRPFLFVFGHSIEPETRIVIESSRVFETQTNMRYRDYIIPTKAVPDPRSLSIINYIHTTAKWILHIPPYLLDGLYEEIKASLGHFDMALTTLGKGKGSGAITIAEIQERIQEAENLEKIE